MKVAADTFSLPDDIDPNWRIAVVQSTYYEREIAGLVNGAVETLKKAGISSVTLHPVLGSFEIPLIGEELATSGKYDALMGFGIIVQGETMHADHLAREVTRAMMDIQVRHRIPFAYEVLHVRDMSQAVARGTSEDNRGREAALAVLHSLAELKRIRS